MQLTRRRILTGLAVGIAAPAIVPVRSLMALPSRRWLTTNPCLDVPLYLAEAEFLDQHGNVVATLPMYVDKPSPLISPDAQQSIRLRCEAVQSFVAAKCRLRMFDVVRGNEFLQLQSFEFPVPVTIGESIGLRLT